LQERQTYCSSHPPQSSKEAAKLFVAEGDVFGLGLLLEDESAAAEHARLTGVAGRFEKPPEGTWLHLEALEGRCVGHSFTVDAGRLTIKTQVPLLLVSQSDEALNYRSDNIRVCSRWRTPLRLLTRSCWLVRWRRRTSPSSRRQGLTSRASDSG